MTDFETNYRTWHTRLSYIKSTVRIVTCIAAVFTASIAVLAVGLLIAEIIGIAEEFV
jgi:hypothetical protein